MAYIYTLEHPTTGEIRYVGVTIQSLEKRLSKHYSEVKDKSRKINWIKSLKKQGLKPIIRLLEEVEDTIRYEMETFYILCLKSWGFRLLNHNNGGSGGYSREGNKEFRHTEESKEKISKANKRPHSKEWNYKASLHKPKPIVQYTLDNMIIREYDSATTAAIELGDINKKKNISSVLRGKRSSAYGFKWRFKL